METVFNVSEELERENKIQKDISALELGDEKLAHAATIEKLSPREPLLDHATAEKEVAENDLDGYQKKYLKYKQKYLELKAKLNK